MSKTKAGTRHPPPRAKFKLQEVAAGRQATVAMMILPNGTCPAQDFFDDLATNVQAVLQHRFQKKADDRTWQHKEQFKRIGGTDLWEFKKHQARFPCFWTKRKKGHLVITHGFSKKSNKTDREEIKRAERLQREFEQEGA